MKRKTNFDWYLPVMPKRATEAERKAILDSHWFRLNHWWRKSGVGKVTRESAIYELLRRHPRIGVERAKLKYQSESIRGFDSIKRYNEYSAIRLIEVLLPTSPKSWPELDSKDRQTIEHTLLNTELGKLLPKPFDNPVIASSQKSGKQAEAEAHHFAFQFMKEIRAMDGVPGEYSPPFSFARKNPFSLLYSALRNGHFVMSIDAFGVNDLQADLEMIQQLYRKEIGRHSKKVQSRRTNVKSILNTIADFESSELQRLLLDEPKKVNRGERDRFQKLFNGIIPLESKV